MDTVSDSPPRGNSMLYTTVACHLPFLYCNESSSLADVLAQVLCYLSYPEFLSTAQHIQVIEGNTLITRISLLDLLNL